MDKKNCNMCGDCCRNGGPALHGKDLPLIKEGIIDLTQIVTLRAGELAWDQPKGMAEPLEQEILKLRGKDGTWMCTFFNNEGNACSIYENRPEECRLLDCTAPEALTEFYNTDRLTRKQILPEGHPFLELMAEHDEMCSPKAMFERVKKARRGNEDAAEAVREMAVYDYNLREALKEKGGMDDEALDFLFGRSAKIIMSGLGARVRTSGGVVRVEFRK